MRPLALFLAVLAACSGTADGEPPAARPTHRIALADTLPCVIDGVVDKLATSARPLDTLELVLSIAMDPHVAGGRRFLEELAARATSRRVSLSPQLVRARIAVALLELGATEAAAALVQQALDGFADLAPYDRVFVLDAAALVPAAAGREPPQVVADSDEPIVALRLVEGLARSGRRDRARELLATIAPQHGTAELGIYFEAAAWLREDEGPRAILKLDLAAVHRVWWAKAAVASRHPDAAAIVDEQLAAMDERGRRRTVSVRETAWMWAELVRLRERLDAAAGRSARASFDTWLLLRDDERAEFRNLSFLAATFAGDREEARRLERRFVVPLQPIPRMELALLRHDVAGALDVLADHRERPALPETTFGVLDGDHAPAATMWLLLGNERLDDEMLGRFDAIVCARRDQ